MIVVHDAPHAELQAIDFFGLLDFRIDSFAPFVLEVSQIDSGCFERIRQRFNHRVIDEIARGDALDCVHQGIEALVHHVQGILDGADPLQDVLLHKRNPDVRRGRTRSHQELRSALPAELTIQGILYRAVLAKDHMGTSFLL